MPLMDVGKKQRYIEDLRGAEALDVAAG